MKHYEDLLLTHVFTKEKIVLLLLLLFPLYCRKIYELMDFFRPNLQS